MKKLKNKVYYTLVIIFTLFISFLVFIYNIENYNRHQNLIRDNLLRVRNMAFKNKPLIDNKNDNINRIIMDYNIYTVLLDYENNITDIISHSEYNDLSIYNIALDIINKNNDDKIKVNNLYFSKYSYNFKNGSFLIIIDNRYVNNILLKTLIMSVALFIIFEILILYISNLITNWVIKPALISFEKQKEFIANASHELKTPLSVIMASQEALEHDKKEKKWLNNIKSEAEKMNNLISSLLDLSKVENSLDKENYSIVNFSKLVQKTVLTFEPLAYENNVHIIDNIKNNIKLKCNEFEINELISILLDNAIKHSYKNENININLFDSKDEIILEVINKGDEIPKEDYERIFERFYRVDKSRNRNDNRYGLGLSIAKSIVLKHDGKIKVNSKNKYTKFVVNFKNKEH